MNFSENWYTSSYWHKNNTGKVSWTSEAWFRKYQRVLNEQTNEQTTHQVHLIVHRRKLFVGDKKRILLILNIFQSKFLASWALFGAARDLFLLVLQLLIPALAPLSLSCKEMVGNSVLDPFSGDHSIRNWENSHGKRWALEERGWGWHDHNLFHSMVLTLDRRSQ